MKRAFRHIIVDIGFLFILGLVAGQEGTFTNPLFNSGADPWIVRHNNIYYYIKSAGNKIVIRQGQNLDDLKQSRSDTIWTAPEGTMWSKEIWAPELHFIDGKWYVYFAADDGYNRNHRMYVIENPSADPVSGEWIFRGKVADKTDKWAIDGTVFRYRGKLYMAWSGWEGDLNGRQDLYIAAMKNPWTIKGPRILLSTPEYPWEKTGDLNNPDDVPHVDVNEGPAALAKGEKLFIAFSASGCWTDSYCIGMLVYDGSGRILDRRSWRKLEWPVLKGDPSHSVYAPGHNSFFKSPDGSEDWIIYHANSLPGQGCGRHRSPRAQMILWDKEGLPVFGNPVAPGVKIPLPAGM